MLMNYVVTFIDSNGFMSFQVSHSMIVFLKGRKKTNILQMKN